MKQRHANITAEHIRQVLLNDWDPHDAARHEAAHGTYDQYIEPLRDLIRSGGSPDDVVAFLHEREKESMCFPSLGTQRLERVAQKLLGLTGDRQPSARGEANGQPGVVASATTSRPYKVP